MNSILEVDGCIQNNYGENYKFTKEYPEEKCHAFIELFPYLL